MSKKNLLGDTVLRRDHEGKLHLMNRKEGGFRSWAMPIDSEESLLALYNVRLGAWDRDEHGEYCPVSRIPREEQPTLHDGEEVSETFKLHDFGPRGVAPALEHSVLSPLLHEGVRRKP